MIIKDITEFYKLNKYFNYLYFIINNNFNVRLSSLKDIASSNKLIKLNDKDLENIYVIKKVNYINCKLIRMTNYREIFNVK